MELRVANYNSFLLLGLSLVLRGAGRVGDQRGAAWPTFSPASLRVAGVVALLAGLVLFKPTIAPIAAAMLFCLLARVGPARLARPLGLALVPIAVFLCWPMLRLGGGAIWLDWLHYFQTSNVDMFGLPWSKGNRSTALFLSNSLGLPLGWATLGLAALLVAAVAAVVSRSGAPWACLKTAVRDPLLALSLGLVVFLALSPLVWVHYYVIALAGALPLLFSNSGRGRVPLLALAAVLLAATAPFQMLSAPIVGSSPDLEARVLYLSHLGLMLSWIPILLASLALLFEAGRKAPA